MKIGSLCFDFSVVVIVTCILFCFETLTNASTNLARTVALASIFWEAIAVIAHPVLLAESVKKVRN